MVGFGFMDNMVMIQAGDLIDNTIGVRFGLKTLAAAACGQIISDMSGVMFGGVEEKFHYIEKFQVLSEMRIFRYNLAWNF